MKTIYIIATITLSTAVISWSILRDNTVHTIASTIEPLRTTSELQLIQTRISVLAEQVAQANATLTILSQTTQTQRSEVSTGDSYSFYPEQESQINGGRSPQLAPDERLEETKRPKVLMVNPTPEQQQSYEELKIQLDDLNFISNLNLQEFSSLPEIQRLPKPLKIVLISKAIEQYNRGNISRDTFLSPASE